MLTVLHSHTVIPSDQTPTGIFPLSDFHQIKLTTHIPLLYVYKPNIQIQSSLSSPILSLIKSLSFALVRFYPFAGRLTENSGDGGRFRLHCNAAGAKLLEAVSDLNLDDLGDFKPTQNVENLVPTIDYNLPIEEIPLFLAQLTRFRCGGFTLVVAVSRAVADGVATIGFVNYWAELSRKQGLDFSNRENREIREIVLRNDPTLLMNSSRNPSTASFLEHSGLFSNSPIWVKSRTAETEDDDDDSVSNCAVLRITKEQVQKLKKKIQRSGYSYTSFQILSGVLWRCVCKAMYDGNLEQPTRLSTLVNSRQRLKPPMSDSYFGIATVPTVTKTVTFRHVMFEPLFFAVGEVRQSLEKVTDEYVRSFLDYIANQRDVRLLRKSGGRTKQKSRKEPNLSVVSWMNFSFHEADFGWGRPVYLGPASIDSEGKAFFINDGDNNGFVVVIRLQLASHEMNTFKRLFYEEVGDVFASSKL